MGQLKSLRPRSLPTNFWGKSRDISARGVYITLRACLPWLVILKNIPLVAGEWKGRKIYKNTSIPKNEHSIVGR